MNRAVRRPIVVHLATLELACHAGGRGFGSRRSRFRSACKKASSVVSKGPNASIGIDRLLPTGLDDIRGRPESRRQTAMSLAVGSSLYPRPINALKESIHDR